MFLDKKLEGIQDAKNRLATCCDLRRHLVHVEVLGIYYGTRSTLSNLSLGLAMAEQILGFIGNRNHNRR
ncbi:MAG: hypothetical protein ABIK15_07475 [Pseudomonadota bacterium]